MTTIEALLCREAHVAVVGLGYVGTPLMAALHHNFSVYGFDTDQRRIAALQRGVDTTRSADAPRIADMSERFTSDAAVLARCSLVIVAVPTPVTLDHRPDLEALRAAARTVGQNIRRGAVVIVESTVYPGVTEEVVGPIIAEEAGMQAGEDFHIGYSPERINPGDDLHTVERLVKVVAGDCREVTDLMTALYGKVTGGVIHRAANIRTAEAAKIIENTQRDLNIALMNEFAMICDRLGLQTGEVLRTASTKWNFARYEPGLVGGHCIGVDPYYLTFAAEQAGHHARVILAGRQVNSSMGIYVAERAVSLLRSCGQHDGRARALILGLTFKENIPDTRNSQVIEMIEFLNEHEIETSVFDPEADRQDVKDRHGISLLQDASVDAPYHVVIAAVRHDAIRSRYSLEELRDISVAEQPVLIDIKLIYDRSAAESTGFIYWGL